MFRESLAACIRAAVPAVSVTTPEWERVRDDVLGVANKMELKFAYWSHVKGLVSGDNQVIADPSNPMTTLMAIEELEDSVIVFFNFNLPLKHPAIQQKVRDIIPYCKANGVLLVFISVSGEIPPELEKEIILLDYELPDKDAIKKTIDSMGEVQAEDGCYQQMIEAATGLTQSESENIIALALAKNNLVLTQDAVAQVKKEKAQALRKSGVLELYEPENLPKVGGLDQLKMWLWERGKAFSPEAREFGLPFPKGILVFGVPGTGKSLIAKTISKQWGFPLLMMGNVLDKFVGESEKRMKDALKIAERMAPCVLMIDEVEKFFAGVGGSSDSGVSTRVFGQFLSWMQETKSPVFVVATANNIGGMPPELLRKGRFDELWFVDLPGRAEREEIFKIHITRRNREVENFDLKKLAKETSGYTGSEIEQVIISGLFRAFSKNEDINTQILLEAAEETSPLSDTMKEDIMAMRDWGKARARLASTAELVAPETQMNAFTRRLKL
ncbi:AAA family ATPase [Bacteroides sp.]|uniref:AAA family ATPase n=1 Tax=Bacteroides sp. TaxID=29523 RepID=UPI002631BC6A|nr:AAA family ATPase [Bacteroides sp.]MDD3040452.1 AAA family ATPase [Bacteroides sp.]